MAAAQNIAFAATNPCHMFDMVRALSESTYACTYYSGYPAWKLGAAPRLDIRSFPLRTLVAYGLLKVNDRFRPSNDTLFEWQDRHFDRSVASSLGEHFLLSGLPGQCLQTFRSARNKGILTLLNHASGPVRQQIRMVQPEYARAGYHLDSPSRFNEAYFQREAEEYNLSDYHCVASSVVEEQLVQEGIPRELVWRVPYGADPTRWKKSLQPVDGPFRIVFAGQLSLRKGIHYLLKALEMAGPRKDWVLDCYGPFSRESEQDFKDYKGSIPVMRHGPVPQEQLAKEFAKASVLVLPSVEEAFGLVVVQALQVGLPCVVASSVGAKDLVNHRENGSIFETRNAEALLNELQWWSEHPLRVPGTYDWSVAVRAFDKLFQAMHHATHPPQG